MKMSIIFLENYDSFSLFFLFFLLIITNDKKNERNQLFIYICIKNNKYSPLWKYKNIKYENIKNIKDML